VEGGIEGDDDLILGGASPGLPTTLTVEDSGGLDVPVDIKSAGNVSGILLGISQQALEGAAIVDLEETVVTGVVVVGSRDLSGVEGRLTPSDCCRLIPD
jgi:hypothetical protein